MMEFYAEIRYVHISAVLASGGLFFLRGLALFAGASWALAQPVRYLSYTIDTVLLTAGVILVTIVHQYPLVHAWITVKLMLLVVYVILGTFAFWRGRTKMVRLVCWLSALAVYATMFSIARTHDPLGFLGFLRG
jgi:uncharacterized membrane protein SirB2